MIPGRAEFMDYFDKYYPKEKRSHHKCKCDLALDLGGSIRCITHNRETNLPIWDKMRELGRMYGK